MMRSTGARFFIVGVLVVLMIIPMILVSSVIDSRVSYSRSTIDSVSEEWGGPQVLSGPVLVLPVRHPVTKRVVDEVTDPETGKVTRVETEVIEIQDADPVYLMPSQLEAAIDTQTQMRSRGIFEVPVYVAQADLRFAFDTGRAEEILDDQDEIQWQEAYLTMGLSDNRALRGQARLVAGGRDLALEPLVGRTAGVRALTGDPRALGTLEMALTLNGAQRLKVAPVGRNTLFSLSSDWPHPSFTGAFLPDSREVRDDGFTAQWTIPHLARALPQVARRSHMSDARNSAFGVRFFTPNDFYQKAYRASSYAILFVALTFLTVLLIENRSGKPAHPVQYILVGLAQAIFVLLMVAYAEQVGFGAAYLGSAGATIALLVLYGAVGLHLGLRTWVLGVMLIVLYGVLYLILQSADYALLAGASLAFVALAVTMIATRNEEWYGASQRGLFGRKSKAPEGEPIAED